MKAIQFTTTFSFTRKFTTADVKSVIESANCAVVSMGEPKRGDGDKEVTVTITSTNVNFKEVVKSISAACVQVSDIDNDVYIACHADTDFDTATEIEITEEVDNETEEVTEVETVEAAPVKTVKFNRSEIMKQAHKLLKRGVKSLSEALKMAWNSAKQSINIFGSKSRFAI